MPTVMEASLDDEKVTFNPHFKEAMRIARQRKWKGFELNRGFEQVSFSLEIEEDPRNPDDWKFHLLYVPYIKEHEHHHILFSLNEAKKIKKFLDQYIKHVGSMKKRKKVRKGKKKK